MLMFVEREFALKKTRYTMVIMKMLIMQFESLMKVDVNDFSFDLKLLTF